MSRSTAPEKPETLPVALNRQKRRTPHGEGTVGQETPQWGRGSGWVAVPTSAYAYSIEIQYGCPMEWFARRGSRFPYETLP